MSDKLLSRDRLHLEGALTPARPEEIAANVDLAVIQGDLASNLDVLDAVVLRRRPDITIRLAPRPRPSRS